MSFFYFNANPLLRWAEAQVSVASPSCKRIAEEVNRIIENSNNINAISEITIAEYQSKLFDWERDNSKVEFDLNKADECLHQLMKWIDNAQIEVLRQPHKLIEKAMAYTRSAAVEKACSLRAWDAAHLFQACDWAKTTGAIVNIVTNDKAFYKFIEVFPEFTAFVKIYDPESRKYTPA